MILNFLGCGCAYRPELGNTSAWFALNKHLFLLDCGENIFTLLKQTQLLSQYEDITVFITHCHADHIGSLSTLISYVHYVEKKRIAVYFPNSDVMSLMTCCGISPEECLFLQDSTTILNSQLTYSALPVMHHPALHCYGYLFTFAGKTFYYSGDAHLLPQDILNAFLQGQINEIYQDATFLLNQGTSHGSLAYLCDIIPFPLRQHVYPMHFSDDLFTPIHQHGFGCCMEHTTQ